LAVKTQYSAILSSLDTLSDPAENQAVEAAGIAKYMKMAPFVVCLMFEDLLQVIHVVHKALQAHDMTLGDASNLIEKLQHNFAKRRCVDSWASLRSRVEDFFAENDVTAFQSSAQCTVGRAVRKVKTPLTMQDFVVPSTLGQRHHSTPTSTSEKMNATTTEQAISQTDEWYTRYTQLYLPIVDKVIGQLNLRFPPEIFAVAELSEPSFPATSKALVHLFTSAVLC
jgi:hypothetical protein